MEQGDGQRQSEVRLHIDNGLEAKRRTPMDDMSFNQVAEWFQCQNLEQSAKFARRDKINGIALKEFNEDDLGEIDVPIKGYKHKNLTFSKTEKY
eukprot:TRINITY_DN3144_c0_g1_i1.p1 TRINITY_DN3144_c0_g1~~TRINITY_DN3144_c0_g1_i1.p1  ORF type:complete len:94 (+),score=14.79 TRINITY_DN3144_c0_g1_i1:277-558(+)